MKIMGKWFEATIDSMLSGTTTYFTLTVSSIYLIDVLYRVAIIESFSGRLKYSRRYYLYKSIDCCYQLSYKNTYQ